MIARKAMFDNIKAWTMAKLAHQKNIQVELEVNMDADDSDVLDCDVDDAHLRLLEDIVVGSRVATATIK